MKTMKKVIALIMIMLLAAGNAMAVNDENEWGPAFAVLERETGLSRDEVRTYQIFYEDGIWSFSVVMKNHPEDEDGLLVFETDDNWNLISMEGPEKINLDRQLEIELKDCFHRDDCAWRMAEVCAKWQVKLEGVSQEQKSKIWPRYLAVIDRGIIVPPEGALDYNTALAAARDAASERMGWKGIDMETLFVPGLSACYVLDGTPVWFIYLEDHSYFEEEYSTDRAMKKYQERLKEAFAGVGQVPPCKIGIVIDAFTGELKEKPMLDYIPVEFHYLDFLIRTDEAVASIAGE